MKMIIVIVGLALTGCASAPKPTIHETVMNCAEQFMDRQAHVLDATQACSHIYGLKNQRTARTVGSIE